MQYKFKSPTGRTYYGADNAQRSLSEIQGRWMELDGVRNCFVQHATLLLLDGGETINADKRGVRLDDDRIPVIGDGSARILDLLLHEYLGFRPATLFGVEDFNRLAVRERERWRALALQELEESQLHPALRKLPPNANGKRRWKLVGEAFGDLLCEASKGLEVVVTGQGKRKERASGSKRKEVERGATGEEARRGKRETARGSKRKVVEGTKIRSKVIYQQEQPLPAPGTTGTRNITVPQQGAPASQQHQEQQVPSTNNSKDQQPAGTQQAASNIRGGGSLCKVPYS